MAASTWTWNGNTGLFTTAADWTLASGPGNASGIPQAGDVVRVPSGTLVNTGQTLSVGPDGTYAKLYLSGTIVGGTILDSGSGLLGQGGTLSGVTYDAAMLDMSPNSSSLTLANGSTVNNAAGTGPGITSRLT
jgi:hypothetical protein